MLVEFPGKFIVVEGGDGSGKSTLVTRLSEWYESQGRKVVCTREPGGSELGRILRAQVLHIKADLSPRAELLLFLSDSAQHMDRVIRPALENGDIVICDRYKYSTMVYQGMNANGLNADRLWELNTLVAGGITPDHVLLLDVPAPQAQSRVQQRNASLPNMTETRYDDKGIEYYEQVRTRYLELSRGVDSDKFSIIDASKSIGSVLTQCMTVLDK